MKPRAHSRYRHLLAVSLTATSALYAIAPAFADGTAAGISIKNTATGTFSDGTTTYNTTSNTVTIDVSEVAGIDILAQPPSNTSPNAGEGLYVDFVVTNVGNDPTQFFIPGTATLTQAVADVFVQDGPIQIVAINTNDTTLMTPINVPPAGGETGVLLGAASGSFAVNPSTPTTPSTIGTLIIRVPIKATATANAGSSVTVSLGNTTPENARNVTRVVNANDLYTVDNANGIGGETNATAPSNGVVEAMATSATITVGARRQAFSTVLKAVSNYSNNNTANNLTDDSLTYKLALRVDNPVSPPTGLVTADLYGTRLIGNGDGTIAADKSYILVSDAIPAGLTFGASAALSSTDPKWIPVYTTDPVATNALSAKWTTAKPLSGITRVGFVYDTVLHGPISKGTAGTGTTISGLTVTLDTSPTFAGEAIANIAQSFGQSTPPPSGSPIPGATAPQIVYDESGDQTSNNGLDGANPDPVSGGTLGVNGGITNGVANPDVDGIDPGKGNDPTNTDTTNTGGDTGNGTKGFGGETTLYTIAVTPLNGPKGQPAAIGPTNNNDDFTNKSLLLAAGLDPALTLDDDQTPAFDFTNTVQNTSASSQIIALLPTAPATATALPDTTKVTITDPITSAFATYTYTAAGGFVYSTGSAGTSATSPVKLTIAPGLTTTTSPQYKLTVDLPGGVAQFTAFPIPVTAFVDANSTGLPAGNPSNTTIDRLYTNYLKLDKVARILDANGNPVAGPAGTFANTPSELNAASTVGNIIEYQITYTNISTDGGPNNVVLPANNLVITENGSAGTNNWFTITVDPKYPALPIGSAADSGSGVISVTVTGTGSNADIQEYQNAVATVAPGTSGRFTFQRKIK
jgi:hypothetical protein